MRFRISVPLISDPTQLREVEAVPAGDGCFRLVGSGPRSEPLCYKRGEIVECNIATLPDGSKGLVATRSRSADPEFRKRRRVYAVLGAFVGGFLGAISAFCFEFSLSSAIVGLGIGSV